MKDILLFNELFSIKNLIKNMKISDQELLILILISENSNLNLSKLSEILSLSKSKLSRKIFKLATLKLIDLNNNNLDRRIKPLQLTQVGYECIISIYHAFEEIFTKIFENENYSKDFRFSLNKIMEYRKIA